eukprot:SAG11_NODE_1222_length_5484_cov_7.843268_2_plen_38_part_00
MPLPLPPPPPPPLLQMDLMRLTRLMHVIRLTLMRLLR